MTEPQWGLRDSGVKQRLDPEQLTKIDQRIEKDLEYAYKSQTHFWQAIVTHKLSDTAAKAIATNDINYQPNFDLESLSSLSFGCLICEQALDRKLVGKRCPGEPKDSPWRRM